MAREARRTTLPPGRYKTDERERFGRGSSKSLESYYAGGSAEDRGRIHVRGLKRPTRSINAASSHSLDERIAGVEKTTFAEGLRRTEQFPGQFYLGAEIAPAVLRDIADLGLSLGIEIFADSAT